MGKLNSKKHTRKDIKTLLINTIEQTLRKLYDNKKVINKMKGLIKKQAKKIASKLPEDNKKPNINHIKSKIPAIEYPQRTNKKFIKQLKDKPSIENIKEALEL